MKCFLLTGVVILLLQGLSFAQKIYECPATVSLRALFSLTPDNAGGIICTIPASQQGSVQLTVFQFDPKRPGNLGGKLYSVALNKSSSKYEGDPVNYTIGAATDPFTPYLFGTTWAGDQYKKAAIAAEHITKFNYGEGFRQLITYPCPVIVQLSVTNATVSSVKIPGLRLPLPFASFQTLPFSTVLEAIRNPLSYPDYTIVAAHRGYWKDVPENSFPAYDLTCAAGTDMVELDTRLTKDDTLVAFHDQCLDRITTGSGKLRDYTWAQVQQMELKDRFGNPTGLRMVSIRQALIYLKGRAIVNLDIKEWITKNPDGSISDLLTPTLKSALKIAKETGTLHQLVIKGKLDADDFQELLDEVGISLNDFLYTPVAFGWDTPRMPRYVGNWLNEGIGGIELTYKVAYDPILRFVPKAINRNKRVGNYTFWPEDSQGVIAEDNVNQPPPLFCKFNYREYYFLNETASGFSKETSTPSTSSLVAAKSLSADFDDDADEDQSPSGGGESASDYGGGSFDALNPKAPRKLTKPGSMNDGRGDWDWLFARGANFVITDRPVLMIDYLKARGKRKLSIPVITEAELPDCVTIEDGSGGKHTYDNLRGMVRKVIDYTKVEFFTPDTRPVAIDTNLVIDEYKQYSNNKTRAWVRDFMKTNNRPCTCKDLFADNQPQYKIRNFPLHTLPEWSMLYPGYDIYINGNWFDVKEPFPLDDPSKRKAVPQAPYKFPCTDVFGFWQSSNGTVLSKVEDPDPDHDNLDAFLVNTSTGKIMLVHTKDVPPFERGIAQFAIGGYIIAENGKPVPYASLPSGSSKTNPKKKTIIGLNGNQLYIAEFQSPMFATYEIADMMVKYYNCTDVFMCDGGGSTSMLSTRGDFPAINVPAGDNITSGSAGEDRNLSKQRVYRPVPNFLGIRVKEGN